MTEKPVSVGDTIKVTIEAVGKKGDGIAKVDNFVVFVPGAQEGNSYDVKITKVLNKVSFGEIQGEGKPATDSIVSKAAKVQESSEDFGNEEDDTDEDSEEEVSDEPEETPLEEQKEESNESSEVEEKPKEVSEAPAEEESSSEETEEDSKKSE